MTKLRVYEYAKQHNMSSKEVITILSRLDIPVNNHMSVMEPPMVSAVEGFFSDVKARAAARSVAMQERRGSNDSLRTGGGAVTTVVVDSQGEASLTSVAGSSQSESKSDSVTSTTNGVMTTPEVRTVSGPSSDDEAGSQITGARIGQPQSPRPVGDRNRPSNNQQSNNYRNDRPRPQGSNDRPSGSSNPNYHGSNPNRPNSGDTRRNYDSDRRPRVSNESSSSASGDRRSSGPSNRPPQQSSGGGRPQGQTSARPMGGQQGAGSRGPRPPYSGGGQGDSRNQGSSGRPPYSSGGGRAPEQKTGFSSSRPDNRRQGTGSSFGGSQTPSTTSSSRFQGGSSGDQNRNGQTGGQRSRRPGERSNNGRPNTGDRRENSHKLQPPRGRRDTRSNHQAVKLPEVPRQVTVDSPMTILEFAHLIRREASEVIKKLLFLGMPMTINQEIDTDMMALVGAELNAEVTVVAPRDVEAEEMLVEAVDEASLEWRPPIVTIMGHVDHGKTTLLDAIRETNVTASEAGGITQHIGAYQVEINHKKITFLDTPGHAAFTTMRARGAQITDITVLVVAADDGVMPQTIEAVNHAKAANVPIIVAVNKMDKPDANPDRIKQELTEYGLVAEEWGGDTIFVPLSALKKEGIEDLLEMILLVAEVADLKASLSMRARGSVIEAELDRGRGPVATVLVQNGILRIGDVVVAGNTFGKIRAMVNDRGRRVKEALPSAPVEIIGLSAVPNAGDLFVVYDDERQGRLVAERRSMRQRAEELGTTSRVTLDDLYKQIQEGEVKDLNVILKADVHGSAEAVLGALQKISVSGVRIRVIHTGVGAITESDILLASASNAIVIGFNVRPETNAAKMAESEKVDVRLHRIIYHLIDEIEAASKGMLDPEYKEVILGRAEIRQLFKISKLGTIAGAFVIDGKMVRDADVRLTRGGVIVFEGKLDSLKRFKDDAKEVATGYECGLTLDHFNDLKEGDIVEAYKMEAIKAE